MRSIGSSALLLFACTAMAAQTPPVPPPQDQGAAAATRPPADNDRSLRPLSPDEIPPNLSFYAVDPLYKPGAPLGWAERRIEERLDRGLVVRAAGDGRAHVSWRLLRDDP
jgi:hypothetical protein